jgi:hypothetical protein
MIKIKYYLKSVIYFLAKRTNLINLNYYKIDGGLGSQIISFLIYSQAFKNNTNIYCDISFFNRSPDDKLFLSNTYRSWRLDNYGIFIDDIKSNSQLRFIDNFKLKPDDEYYGVQFEKFMYNLDQDILALIPNLGFEKEMLKNYGICDSNYSVIHIRKGDFLKQASYLVNDELYINLINSLNNFFTPFIFVVSDERLDSDFVFKIKSVLKAHTIIFEFSRTDIETHGLMRNAKILITSNSMFSLSAAILRPKNLLTITPKVFFGKNFEKYNIAINNLSDWHIV